MWSKEKPTKPGEYMMRFRYRTEDKWIMKMKSLTNSDFPLDYTTETEWLIEEEMKVGQLKKIIKDIPDEELIAVYVNASKRDPADYIIIEAWHDPEGCLVLITKKDEE